MDERSMTVSNEDADKGESICFLIIPTITTAAAVITIIAAATEVLPARQVRQARGVVRVREDQEASRGRWGLKGLSDFRVRQAQLVQPDRPEQPVLPEL